MNIHFFQHVPFESPAYILTWAAKNSHTVTATRFYEPDDQLPEIDSLDSLIIMGGPMGPYDEDRYPWLVKEKAFISAAIRTGKKLFGICLGAQLIADACGAPVGKAPNREIGWFPVYPGPDIEAVSWLARIFNGSTEVFHWHNDRFGIPEGALNLLSSEANSNQAFILNNRLLGFQFHLEVTTEVIRDLIHHCKNELDPLPFVQDEALLPVPGKTEKLHHLIEQVLDHFFQE